MSVLSLSILPRSKFFQNLLFNLLGVCIGACIALLTCYCAITARANTSSVASSSGTGTSSTQQRYSIARVPVQCLLSGCSSIFASPTRSVSSAATQRTRYHVLYLRSNFWTYAPTFSSMDQAIAFVKRLLEAFSRRLRHRGRGQRCGFPHFYPSNRCQAGVWIRGAPQAARSRPASLPGHP